VHVSPREVQAEVQLSPGAARCQPRDGSVVVVVDGVVVAVVVVAVGAVVVDGMVVDGVVVVVKVVGAVGQLGAQQQKRWTDPNASDEQMFGPLGVQAIMP
jgi:hypothetical protein